jgi:hypothetical protein
MKALLAALALSSVAICAVAQNWSADERRTIDRRHAHDPFGNRIELIEPHAR